VNKVSFGYFARPDELQKALNRGEHSAVRQSQSYLPVMELPVEGFNATGQEVNVRATGTILVLHPADQEIVRGTKSSGRTTYRTYTTYTLSVDQATLTTDAVTLNPSLAPLNFTLETGRVDEAGNDVPGDTIQLVGYTTTDFAKGADEISLRATGAEQVFVDASGREDEYDVFEVTYNGTTERLVLVTRPKISIFVAQENSDIFTIALEENNRRSEVIEFQFENYDSLLNLEKFDRALVNTVFVTLLVVLGQLVTSLMGGYAFSRMQFAGRDTIFLLYLGSIMVPFVVLIVPMYRLMVEIGWQERIVSLIVPWIFTAYGTFLMRQFFMSIPVEIEEAALLDGCGRFRILWQIFVPLSTPAIATQAIFTFLYAWNSFLWPLFMFGDKPSDSRVLTLALISLANRASSGEPNLVFTGAAVTILPPIIVFILAQKYFVEGIATSGLKG
jgi:multiple sugar transport system permease protein